MKNLVRGTAAFAILAGVLMAPATSGATTKFAVEQIARPFIYYLQSLSAGTQYTIETRNLTAGGDTVLHVVYNTGSGWQQLAANDDSSTLASKVIFTAPSTVFVRVLVRSYSDTTDGNADLYVNGTRVLTQNPFGGFYHFMTWTAGEQFRGAVTRFNGGDDGMIVLLRSTTDFLQIDDDSGPSFLPFAQASTTESSGSARVGYGLYPGQPFGYAVVIVQSPPTPSNDTDGDGLTNALENLVGTASNNDDSDFDSIPDGVETIGGSDSDNWVMSRISSIPHGTNATRKNAFIELDYMINAADSFKSRQPYAALPTDVNDLFYIASPQDVTVIIDGAIPWRQNIGLDGCSTGVPDCVDFRTQKASSFSSLYPNRRPFFHYSIFAYQQDNGCVSGRGEVGGNDFMITLGCSLAFTEWDQRGTFMHEFGHNLRLTHNGNDDSDINKNSVVHNSVMNYRYQINGTSPNGTHTYSTGINNCANCATSPKNACVTLRSANQCNTPAGTVCDCDATEWNFLINWDMNQFVDYQDGVSLARTASSPPPALAPLNLDRSARRAALMERTPGRAISETDLTKAIGEELKQVAPARGNVREAQAALIQAKLNEGDPMFDRAAREAAVPKSNVERRKAAVLKQAAQLKTQGLVEGVDFTMASDGSAVLMP